MLEWPKGSRITDGIWGEFWYNNVIQSTCFKKQINKYTHLPKHYNSIFNEANYYYLRLYKNKMR